METTVIKTGISVLVYRPLKIVTEDHGEVSAAYRLGLVLSNESMFLIDQFGCGTELKNGLFYNQPVYKLSDPEGLVIPGFKDRLVGEIPIDFDALSLLKSLKTLDLAEFITYGPNYQNRLDDWAGFFRAEQNRATA